jgi:hypothetical protein
MLPSSNKIETRNYLGLLRSEKEILLLDKEINIIGRGKSCNIVINVSQLILKTK